MKKSLLVILILLTGCASKQTVKKEASQDELENITNDSFNWPAPREYQVLDDFIDEKVASYNDVLKEESLSKIPQEELEEPNDVSRSIDKAILACYRGNFSLADSIFDELLKEYRKNPIYWNQVGNCFMMRGDERKALLFYNKSRDLKKDYSPPINNIGVIFEKAGFYQKALKSYEEARNVSSFSLTPIFNLAQIYAMYGFIDEGKQLFESMIRLNSKDQDALHGLAFLEMAVGNYGKAISIFDRMSSDYYLRPEVGCNLAYSLFLNGNKEKAKDLLDDLRPTKDQSLLAYVGKIRSLIK